MLNIWKEFKESIETAPFDYSKWLYNGDKSKDRPADLGYYTGYKITEGFYNNSKDKKKALRTILKRGKYKKVYRESGYGEGCG
jgi:uncharacterized protein YjaZ